MVYGEGYGYDYYVLDEGLEELEEVFQEYLEGIDIC